MTKKLESQLGRRLRGFLRRGIFLTGRSGREFGRARDIYNKRFYVPCG